MSLNREHLEKMADTTASIECRTLRYAKKVDHDLSVLQYNILADGAIPRGDQGVNYCGEYLYCPKEFRYMNSKLNLNVIVKGIRHHCNSLVLGSDPIRIISDNRKTV